jgi:hypothetical protein
VNESVKLSSAVAPAESDIAVLAHQLWRDRGCPVGSSQQDWFRALAALESAFVAKCEELLRGLSISSSDAGTVSEVLVEFEWEGHWEAWERECGDARWVSDLPPRALVESRIANRTPARM